MSNRPNERRRQQAASEENSDRRTGAEMPEFVLLHSALQRHRKCVLVSGKSTMRYRSHLNRYPTRGSAKVAPILGMHVLSPAYLDAYDLAEILKVSPATILRRAKSRPHTLPLPAHLGERFPLRWRRQDVISWLTERASALSSSCSPDDAATPNA